MIVIPAIIPHTKEQLESEIKKVKNFCELIQIDITDGVFVPTKTWPFNGRDADYWEKIKGEEEGWPYWLDVEVELHLMIKNPEETLVEWIKTGVTCIVAHIESTDDFQGVIDICRENSVDVGLAIKPSTDISRIENFVSQTDFIQVMGSDMLGKHNVELDDKAIVMIKKLRATYPESIIAIDIGVDEDTAEILVDAGVDKFVSGGFILDSNDPGGAFENLSSF
ncbi:MAG: hypothetical protein V4690_00120 [Patescibacteria group bacterium]